jgi:hypothetical protein
VRRGEEDGEKELTTSHKLLRNQKIKILKHIHTHINLFKFMERINTGARD